jgi:hypothetical protein
MRIIAVNGDGSYGSPFSGSLTTNMTWSGTVYVNGDITVNGFTLTINPGSIIVFLTPGADLIITGTGVLNASGGSGSNMIRFTADSDNSGTFGGAGETWGHISFHNMTTTNASIINNCIIEYGHKYTGTFELESSGGGIYSDFSSLTISNSIIRNNYAGWGGGIYISNASPTISSCIVTNNIGVVTAGGLLFYPGCASIVQNTIVEKNNCTGGGGGGGVFIGGNPGNLRFINCVFASNTAVYGPNIRFYTSNASTGPQFFNTIVWGNSNSINYYDFPTSSSDFNFCAIQGYSSGYTNCINISGTNGDASGPNFNDPNNSDYSILFISPCRDAGTIPTPAVPNDFIGKSRIGPYDIGAYEVQYSRWSGTTNTNWSTSTNWFGNLLPTPSTTHVVIPPASNNPEINVPYVTMPELVIEPDGLLTISPSGQVTVNSLINNGTLDLSSDASAMFSLMMNSYTGTGYMNIGMYLTGGGGTGNWRWHYVAVPTIGLFKTVFTAIEPYNLMFYDDFQIPDITSATDNDGWVWHDGYKTGDPLAGPYSGTGFNRLFVEKGYAFYHSSPAVINFSNLSYLLTTLPSFPLQYNGLNKQVPANYGYNLVGNSLTCGLNWNLITASGDVNATIYYTIDYKIGSYVRNAPDGINGATEHIPPLQGFLVRANATGASLDFTNAREHSVQNRYKKSLEINNKDTKGSGSSDPFIKIELDNPENQDETVVWFNQNATNSFDGAYDGLKLLSSGYDQIYSWGGTQKFGINSMPLPTENLTIPLAVKLLNSSSTAKIVASQLVGLDNYSVTLTDKANSNFSVDLKTTPNYTFSSDAGTFPDRFILTVGTITTGISEHIIPDKDFNVYAFDKTLNIDLLNAEWEGKSGVLNIYDLTGRKILEKTNLEWFKGTLTKIPLNIPQGIYIVELKAENQKFVTKINIIK